MKPSAKVRSWGALAPEERRRALQKNRARIARAWPWQDEVLKEFYLIERGVSSLMIEAPIDDDGVFHGRKTTIEGHIDDARVWLRAERLGALALTEPALPIIVDRITFNFWGPAPTNEVALMLGQTIHTRSGVFMAGISPKAPSSIIASDDIDSLQRSGPLHLAIAEAAERYLTEIEMLSHRAVRHITDEDTLAEIFTEGEARFDRGGNLIRWKKRPLQLRSAPSIRDEKRFVKRLRKRAAGGKVKPAWESPYGG